MKDDWETFAASRPLDRSESLLGSLAAVIAMPFVAFRRKHAVQTILDASVLHFNPDRCESIEIHRTKPQVNRPLGHKRRVRARTAARGTRSEW